MNTLQHIAARHRTCTRLAQRPAANGERAFRGMGTDRPDGTVRAANRARNRPGSVVFERLKAQSGASPSRSTVWAACSMIHVPSTVGCRPGISVFFAADNLKRGRQGPVWLADGIRCRRSDAHRGAAARISDAAPSDPGAWPTVKPRPPVLGPAGEPVCPGRVSHTSFGWGSAPPPQSLVGGQGPLPVTPNDT